MMAPQMQTVQRLQMVSFLCGFVDAIVLSPDANDLYVVAGGTIDVMVAVDLNDSGQLGDTVLNCAAVATPAGHTEVGTGSNGSTVSGTASDPWCAAVEVGDPLPDVDLRASKSCDPIVPGSTFNCRVTVTNRGPGEAFDVTVADVLRNAPVMLVQASASSTTQTGTILGRLYACSNGANCTRNYSMPAGVSDTVRFQFYAEPDDISASVSTLPELNYGMVASDNPDTDHSNNHAFVNVYFRSQVDLSIQKTLLSGGDGNVAPGGSAIFELTIRNDGPSDADGAVVTDAILSGPGQR